jgi:steroid 5-alpha reductase family enzyme
LLKSAGGLSDVELCRIGFAAAFSLQTEKFYDLFGSLTFVALTIYAFLASEAWVSPRACIAAALVLVWATRLGAFLFARVMRDGRDSRFEKIKLSAPRFFVAWTLQGVWVFATALPVYVLCARTPEMVAEAVTGGLTPLPFEFEDVLTLGLWVAGFLLEVVADQQKSQFRSVSANHEKFIKSGVWAWCRHPNYLGEILLWWSMSWFCGRGLTGLWMFAIAGPLVETALLLFVSGIPLLEQAADKKWGTDRGYLDYKKRTPVLIPFVY